MEVKDFLVFGPFRADVRRRALSHGGEVIPLPPKAFDVLVALLQRPGETVSKDELMKAVWPDTFVEEGNLTQMIFLLRKALGDSGGGQPFIVTVPRQGYRFVGYLSGACGTAGFCPGHRVPARCAAVGGCRDSGGYCRGRHLVRLASLTAGACPPSGSGYELPGLGILAGAVSGRQIRGFCLGRREG